MPGQSLMLCWHVFHVMLQAGVEVAGIMGTSAGALTGSLYAAGYTPKEVRQDGSTHCRQAQGSCAHMAEAAPQSP